MPTNQVCVNMGTCAIAAGAGGTVDDVLGDDAVVDMTSGWRLQAKHLSEEGRPDYVGSVAAKHGDRRADFAKVMLWSPQSRSLNVNLASVFGKEGIDAARRESAALIAGRTELMARCYATLRVALQDLIEWKVGGGGDVRLVLCEVRAFPQQWCVCSKGYHRALILKT